MPELLQEPTQAALWQRLISDAQQRAGHRLDEPLESYLVFALMRHVGDNTLGHEALALKYLRRCEEMALQRDQLRDVGDQCLLIAGLFPERALSRRVPVGYYIELGSGAYRDLSDALRAGFAELYRQLAEAFEILVRVLLAAREAPDSGLEAVMARHERRLNRSLH